MSNKIRVKLSTAFPDWPLKRQTPGRGGGWGNYQFFENEPIEECDFWVVYGGVKDVERCVCAPENTILVTTEPPSVLQYETGFLNQFATVITCQLLDTTASIVRSQQSMPWMVGASFSQAEQRWSDRFSLDYDELSNSPFPTKTKLASVITSSKAFTAGHAERLGFVHALVDAFPGQIDLFGRGVRDVEDKWQALSQYRYHVVIENSSYADYWTEKLSDAILAGCYPIYHGCPNIQRYFRPSAIQRIDIGNPDEAISIVKRTLSSEVRESSLEYLTEAKNSILNEYNLFPMIVQNCSSDAAGHKRQELTIRPMGRFIPFSRKLSVKTRSLVRSFRERIAVK